MGVNRRRLFVEEKAWREEVKQQTRGRAATTPGFLRESKLSLAKTKILCKIWRDAETAAWACF
jgi:hypothetical protein